MRVSKRESRPLRLLALALVGVPVAPASAPASPSAAVSLPAAAAAAPAWRAPVADLLTRRAAAVERGDERAFAETMSGAPEAFVRAKLAWLRRLRALPAFTYRLEPNPDGFADLAAGLRRRPEADEVHVVQATERLGFRGYDARPSADDVFLTVIRRGARWSVVSDSNLADLGVRSARNLWDFAPVAHSERGGALILYHRGNAEDAGQVLDGARAAIRRIGSSWPLRWAGRAVVEIPGSPGEIARMLDAPFDLGPFVAFTVSAVDRSDGYRLVASRIVLQPGHFFGHSAGFRADTLGHEMLHAAAGEVAGPFNPSWIEEGVAQFYGQRTPPGLGALRRRAASRAFDGRMPDDFVFSTGSDAEIGIAYVEAYSFVAYLARRFGRDAGARLYRALGSSAPSAGTRLYHLDRAARESFGVSFAALERAWAKELRG